MIVCFDVCGTLYRGNTTQDFCRFITDYKGRGESVLLELNLFLGKVFSRIGLPKIAHKFKMTVCIYQLRNYNELQLYEMANAFWSQRWNAYSIKPLLKIMKDYQKGNANILLLSAAIEPPIKSLAGLLGVNYISTTLKYHPVSGKVIKMKNDLTGKKELVLREYIKKNDLKGKIHFYSDNITDLPLVSKVDKGYFITSNKKADEIVKRYKGINVINI